MLSDSGEVVGNRNWLLFDMYLLQKSHALVVVVHTGSFTQPE